MNATLHIEPGRTAPEFGQPLGFFICRMVNGKSVAISWVEDEADAKLLAAAPEMKAMLVRLRSILRTIKGESSEELKSPHREQVINRRIEEINALIVQNGGAA